MMTTLIQDLRFALRVLRKNPSFSLIGFLTLALGIGATTAIFSVVYGVLLRPLPYEKPEQIVRLWEASANGHPMNFADPNFDDMYAQNHSLQGLAEYTAVPTPVSGGSEPTRNTVTTVSQDFFSILRVQPVRGRSFNADEQRYGAAAQTAMVSYGYWQQYLGSAENLDAIKLRIDNHPVSVIGVLPVGFHFPDDSSIWLPRGHYEHLTSRTAHNWRVIARLRDGVSSMQAHAELSGIARQIKQQYAQDVDLVDVSIAGLQEALAQDVRPALLVLLGAVGFLLLIACANVANLLLVQANAREKELAIRSAIGAGRLRLVRQFLTEALLLSFGGGLAGLLAAWWGVKALSQIAPTNLGSLETVSMNWPVLIFALGISFVVAVGLGIFTAFRATAGNVQQRLAEHGRSQVGAFSSQRLGRSIIAGQLAITLVLLTGAGLLGRSLIRLLAVDPGFRIENIVTADLIHSAPSDHDRIQFLNQLLTQLAALPGVREAGATSSLPLAQGLSDGTYVLLNPGEQPPSQMQDMEKLFHDNTRTGHADYNSTSEGYFRALGIPLVRGRWFDDHDTIDAPHVALINEAMAKDKWPNQNPLGHTIEFGNMDGDLRPLTIVGILGNIRQENLESPPNPTVYVTYRQRPQRMDSFSVVLRTATDPAATIAASRKIVRTLDPDVPPNFSMFTQVLSRSLGTRRFNLILVGAFAGTALLLAITGLYGVMTYVVTQRTAEFGIRTALGAAPANILGLVLKQGITTTLAGVAIGIAGALAMTRTLHSLLFGLSAADPLTFVAVALVLIVVALLACYLPARRAAKVDPMVALRYE
jgi:predicted permease